MQRYFAIDFINNNSPILNTNDIHHILHVMRMKKGDDIEVIYHRKVYICRISSTTPFSLEVISSNDEHSELDSEITLFFCLSKGHKNDLVIQKATELGVNRIILVETSRCVQHLDDKDFIKKKERYLTIAKEASEQCRRLVIPSIEGVYSLKDLSLHLCKHNYVAYEKCKGSKSFIDFNTINKGDSISILIGPEGGLDIEEVELLEQIGFKPISLGNRILRAETAVFYALSIIGSHLENE